MAAVHPACRQPARAQAANDQRRAVGARLRAARQLARVSLGDAARSAGLTHSHVSAIERGAEPMISTHASDLGRALRCPPEWLVAGWADDAA